MPLVDDRYSVLKVALFLSQARAEELRVKKRRLKSFPCCVSSWYSKRLEANLMPFG